MSKKDYFSFVKTLVDQLIHINDSSIRQKFIINQFTPLNAEDFVEILYIILSISQRKDSKLLEVIESFLNMEPLIEIKGNSYFSDAYTLARKKNYDEVVSFLKRPLRKKINDNDISINPNQLANELTLGERKALAMSTDFRTIEKLMFDPHPAVIQKLLHNPRLTEAVVVKIAAKRPNRASILKEIFVSYKWRSRYNVKVAIARNPYTPIDISLKLLPLLKDADLEDIIEDSTMNDDVKEAALMWLKKRIGGIHEIL